MPVLSTIAAQNELRLVRFVFVLLRVCAVVHKEDPKMSGRRIVFTGDNVLVDHRGDPRPATLIVDKPTGKITEIVLGRHDRAAHPDVSDDDWIDAGDKFVLPGLVE